MLSFGIEWDTNALTLELPTGKKEKLPVLEGKDWSLTLEGIDFHKLRDNEKDNPDRKEDCMFSLEVQIGPFISNSMKLNTGIITRAIQNFYKEVWNGIKTNKHITVDGKNYPVLSYAIGGTKETRYKDCKLKENGTLKNFKGSDWGYITSLDNVTGRTQFTIGIPLGYVPNIFRMYVKLLKDCMNHETKCYTIPRKSYLNLLTEAYFDSYKQCQQINELKLTDYISYNVLSLIMLCNYTINITNTETKSYTKSLYHCKPRSNFASIYQNVLEAEEKDVFDIWAKYRTDNYHSITTIDSEGYEISDPLLSKAELSEWFDQITKQPMLAYTVSSKKIGKYQIVTTKNQEIIKNAKKVYYAPLPGGGPDVADIVGGEIVIIKLGQDLQEWTTGPNNEVYFEFRAPETVLALTEHVRNNSYTASQGADSRGLYTPFQLVSYTGAFIEHFLNKLGDEIEATEEEIKPFYIKWSL
jgi:hypothetical protein